MTDPSQQSLIESTVNSAATDHLAHLPKMSPTAGVGMQDYVEINPAAVAALLLGVLSILAIVDDVWVAICGVGLFIAVLAVRQIKRSNGTQTGQGIAMIGLFLCTSIGSYVVGADTLDGMARSSDRAAIAHLCQQLGEDLRDRTYDAAYDLFSARFKARVSRQDFVSMFKGMQDQLTHGAATGTGPVTGASGSGVVSFSNETDSGAFAARSEISFRFEHAVGQDPIVGIFRKNLNTWSIDSLPSVFPTGKQE